MDLHAVHADVHRPAGGGAELRHDPRDLLGFQGARDGALELAGEAAYRHAGVDRAGGLRLGTAQQVRVAHAPAVHDLQEQAPAVVVDRLGHPRPAGGLLCVRDPGLAGEGAARERREDALGHHQARRGTLAVVLHVQVCGHAVLAGALPGQGGHGHAVVEAQGAEVQGVEQGRHGIPSVGSVEVTSVTGGRAADIPRSARCPAPASVRRRPLSGAGRARPPRPRSPRSAGCA